MSFKPYSFERSGYSVSAKKKSSAEITMYGEIVERRPVDWWTGEEIKGDFIIQSEFLDDLNAVVEKGCKSLTLRINSPGGDAGVSITIHNRLRELQNDGLEVTGIIDGIAMSGGSLIMCACNTVKVNPSSLIMIHKCWSLYFGAYNADELRHMAESQDAYDKAQCSIYARKTGLSDTKILHMMSETTYMTGAEAIEKGFADELLDSEPAAIAASANRESLIFNGHSFHLPKGMKAPESIETVSTLEGEDIKKSASVSDTDSTTKEVVSMATNLEELRAENAELATAIESEVRAAVSAEQTSAIEEAVANERERLAEIDELASLYDAESIHEAKYGENPCSAQELTFREAVKAARTGSAFMANAKEDTKASNVNKVKGASAPDDDKGAVDVQAEAKADFAAYKKIKEGK